MLFSFRTRIWLVWLMMMAMPAICAAPEGILHPGSGTTVDGTVALEGMHVFGGQLLRTPHGQFSELLTRRSSLRLLGDSKLQFNGDSAELVTGGVILNTASQFSVQGSCAGITPVSTASARYIVQLQEKTVYVTAQQSDVNVRSRKTVRVSIGKTVAVFCAAPKQDIVFLGSTLPSKVIMGAAAGATSLGALPQSGPRQYMSSSSPSQ